MKYLKPGLICFALTWAGFGIGAASANEVPAGLELEKDTYAVTSATRVADRCSSLSQITSGTIAPAGRLYVGSESGGGFAPISPLRQAGPFLSQSVGVLYGFTSLENGQGGADTAITGDDCSSTASVDCPPAPRLHMDVRGVARPSEFQLPGNWFLSDILMAQPREADAAQPCGKQNGRTVREAALGTVNIQAQRPFSPGLLADGRAHAFESSFVTASANMLYGLNGMPGLRGPLGSLWSLALCAEGDTRCARRAGLKAPADHMPGRETFDSPIGRVYRVFSASFFYMHPFTQALPFFSNNINVQFDRLDRLNNLMTAYADGGCGFRKDCAPDSVRWRWGLRGETGSGEMFGNANSGFNLGIEPGLYAGPISQTLTSGFVAHVSVGYSTLFFSGSFDASYGKVRGFAESATAPRPVIGREIGPPERKYVCHCSADEGASNDDQWPIGDGPRIDLDGGLSIASITRPELSPIPIPAAFPLLAGGIVGLGALGVLRRRRARQPA